MGLDFESVDNLWTNPYHIYIVQRLKICIFDSFTNKLIQVLEFPSMDDTKYITKIKCNSVMNKFMIIDTKSQFTIIERVL